MKNIQYKGNQLSKNKENKNPNQQENKIEDIKIKVNNKKDIKKIFLPFRKGNIGIHKKQKTNINNNTNNLVQNKNSIEVGDNPNNKKYIVLNRKKNNINSSKIYCNYKTEKNIDKNLHKKKKSIKTSIEKKVFGSHKNKIGKYIERVNNNIRSKNIESQTKTFSNNKENSLDNCEKSWDLIQKFADNFKNKERSESLKNALNMFKRYKSLSSMSNKNKLNNSSSSINIIKNKSYYEKKNNIFLNDLKRKENTERIENKNLLQNKHKNFFKENKDEKSKDNKVRKYFLRKVVREEKCYIDKNGNIHVVDFKQSLIDDKNKLKKNKITTKKAYKTSKNKKINVEINQINNINSYNNISDINQIKNLKKCQNKNNVFHKDKYNFLTERTEPNHLRNILLSKKIHKIQNNYKYYENKIKNLPLKIEDNNITNNTSFDRITHRTVHSFGKDFPYCYYNNIQNSYNAKLTDYKKYNQNIQEQNYIGFNNINEYNYKNYYEPYYIGNIFAQNNSNCSFYESKSLSGFKEKFFRPNNSQSKFNRNNAFDINYSDYIDNSNNYYDEDLNNKTLFNSYILDYNSNYFNNRQNSGKINSYRLIRIPKYKN